MHSRAITLRYTIYIHIYSHNIWITSLWCLSVGEKSTFDICMITKTLKIRWENGQTRQEARERPKQFVKKRSASDICQTVINWSWTKLGIGCSLYRYLQRQSLYRKRHVRAGARVIAIDPAWNEHFESISNPTGRCNDEVCVRSMSKQIHFLASVGSILHVHSECAHEK